MRAVGYQQSDAINHGEVIQFEQFATLLAEQVWGAKWLASKLE